MENQNDEFITQYYLNSQSVYVGTTVSKYPEMWWNWNNSLFRIHKSISSLSDSVELPSDEEESDSNFIVLININSIFSNKVAKQVKQQLYLVSP